MTLRYSILLALTLSLSHASIEETIDRGCKFLTSTQNTNGSWGGPRRTKGLELYAPVPGGHDAFTLATTAIAVSGLIAHEAENSDITHSIDTAEAWIIDHNVKRPSEEALYNIWAHAYSLKALTDLSKRSNQTEPYKKVAQEHYNRLLKYEFVGDGWGYYNLRDFGGIITQKPSGSNNSFITATVLVAIAYTREHLEIEVDEKRLQAAYNSLTRQRLPDGSYLYGDYLKNYPRAPINRPVGSLARTPAAHCALLASDHHTVSQKELIEWSNRFVNREGFLINAIKRPLPHEAPFGISGYFYYYGHYYLSEAVGAIKDAEIKAKLSNSLIESLIKKQEKDGSWWDYPLFDYHQAYGTGYVLTSLKRHQKTIKSDSP